MSDSEIDQLAEFLTAFAPALTMMGYGTPGVIKGPDMIRYQWKIGDRFTLTMVMAVEDS